MGHEKRIVAAFTENSITQILVIDDVYDAPVLTEVSGDLLDFLVDVDGVTACQDAGVADEVITAAVKAGEEGDVESEDLIAVVEALYRRYVETREARFDPGNFATLKAATLAVLDPLIALLKKCGPTVTVHTAGLGDGAPRFQAVNPQVVFLDYYLSQEAVGAGLTTAVKRGARTASIDLLSDLLKSCTDDHPAVVLMSSEQVKKEANGFRETVEKQGAWVLALRFRFLQKGWISAPEAGVLSIQNEAADALLDTSQGYVFGKVLQKALTQWRKGAEDALKTLLGEIGKLEPKDFAYLFRFRLATEGERMGDYLEWLFGESLRASTAEGIDWQSDPFKKLDDATLSKGIEGAFDGPSTAIAKIFHRIKVDEHLPKHRARHALGDLFIKPKTKTAIVVITPDCDLVPRKGKTKVDRVLVMEGELKSFKDDSSSADQFIIYKSKPYSLRWNPKRLVTYPVDGPHSLRQLKGLEFLGSLRPLYAQEVQRMALTDLSRIGLAVSPTMGVDAKITVYIRRTAGQAAGVMEALAVDETPMATVLPERGGAGEGHKVLLRRSFVHALVDALKSVDAARLSSDDKAKLTEFLKEKNEDQLISGFLVKGAALKAKGPLGTSIVIGTAPDNKKQAAWLQFVLELTEEALEDLVRIDPTLLPTDGTLVEAA